MLASAKTGSGKTLAFLIPAIQRMKNSGFQQKNGTGVVVIGPTRELVMQIYDCLKDLIDNMGGGLSVGVVMGGVPRKTEEIKLSKGKTSI